MVQVLGAFPSASKLNSSCGLKREVAMMKSKVENVMNVKQLVADSVQSASCSMQRTVNGSELLTER